MKVNGSITFIASGVPLHVEYKSGDQIEITHVEVDGSSHVNLWGILPTNIRNEIENRISEVEFEKAQSLYEAAGKLVQVFNNCSIQTLSDMLRAFDDYRYCSSDHYGRIINEVLKSSR